jgi:hypothetical protein
MQTELENVLSAVAMCDSKNLTKLINEYTPYSFIEICFNIASVELSIKTGLENEEGYLTESVILDMLAHPNKYKKEPTVLSSSLHNKEGLKGNVVPFNKRIINKFLREYVTDNDNFEKVISALMAELSCCEYDDFQRIITKDAVNRDYDNEEYNEEDEKYYLHLEELLQQLTWLFTYFDIYTILKEHTQLTHKEIDDIVELLEETESFDSY